MKYPFVFSLLKSQAADFRAQFKRGEIMTRDAVLVDCLAQGRARLRVERTALESELADLSKKRRAVCKRVEANDAAFTFLKSLENPESSVEWPQVKAGMDEIIGEARVAGIAFDKDFSTSSTPRFPSLFPRS